MFAMNAIYLGMRGPQEPGTRRQPSVLIAIIAIVAIITIPVEFHIYIMHLESPISLFFLFSGLTLRNHSRSLYQPLIPVTPVIH